MEQVFLFIKRFLLVSCIASGIVFTFYFRNKFIFKGREAIYEQNTYRDYGFSKFILVVGGRSNDVLGEDNYLFKLYIPKIDLFRNIYDIDDRLNDVDINIELLESSIKEKNLYFLASHSGGGQASYFDNLIYLEKGDIIFLNNKNVELRYVIDKIFYIEKNGYFEVEEVRDTIFLITCSLNNKKEQLIVRGKRVI